MEDDNWLARGWLYSFLMHNHWVVDVPIAQGGDYVFRYSLATHGSDWTYNDAHHFGWSTLSPLRVYTVAATQQGKWGETARSFLEVHPANVYVAGFKTAEDGKGVILRLYEGAGLATNAVNQFQFAWGEHQNGRTVRWARARAFTSYGGEQLRTRGTEALGDKYSAGPSGLTGSAAVSQPYLSRTLVRKMAPETIPAMLGTMRNIHTCAMALPPTRSAGPRLRAGLTETPVMLIPKMWIATRVIPIAKPAICVGAPPCVEPKNDDHEKQGRNKFEDHGGRERISCQVAFAPPVLTQAAAGEAVSA